MTWPTRPPLGIKCGRDGCDNYASGWAMIDIPACAHHLGQSDVICSYFECPERATKNLTVTEKFGLAQAETYEVPYCDVHYEEYR